MVKKAPLGKKVKRIISKDLRSRFSLITGKKKLLILDAKADLKKVVRALRGRAKSGLSGVEPVARKVLRQLAVLEPQFTGYRKLAWGQIRRFKKVLVRTKDMSEG
jgi:hypothetical protein